MDYEGGLVEKLRKLKKVNNATILADFVVESPDLSGQSAETSASIKALTVPTRTSSNATRISESISVSKDKIFSADRNLGNCINSLSVRNLLIWEGACQVHEEFALEKTLEKARTIKLNETYHEQGNLFY